MAYNPGITNRSGEILAQGIASAAQTRMQGYQNATNTLLKSFTDLNKKQQEEEIKRNEALAKFKSDPDLMAKLGEKGNEDLKARYDRINAPVEGFWAKYAGRGDLEDSDLLYKYATGTQEATNRATAKTMLGFATDDAAARKAAADIAAKEYANLQTFRTNVANQYASGAEKLSQYNTFTTDQENKQKNEQVALGNQFISGARNDLSNTPTSMVSGIGGKAYAPPPVKQFDTLPKYSQLGNTGMPPASQMGMPPSQVVMPQSMSGLTKAPSPLGYQTPEEINQMIYDYTPGSNSAQQRIYAMRDVLTPQLMQGENTIQASMDKSSRAQAMAEARLRNSEIRRKEADIYRREAANRDKRTLELAINADQRATIGQGITQASADNTAAQQASKTARGRLTQERQELMDKEAAGDPQTAKMLAELNAKNFYVEKKYRKAVENYINNLNVSQETKDGIIDRLRE